MTAATHLDIPGTAPSGGPGLDWPAWERANLPATPLPVIGRAAGSSGARPASVVLREGARNYVVALADRAGTELMALGPFEEAEVIAAWRALGASTGLPLVMVGPDGAREEAFPQIGRVRFGGAIARRRRGQAGGRRPRFLVRRKVGRLPARPLVHRGEPEMIGGGAA
jgi:hypothetical protein